MKQKTEQEILRAIAIYLPQFHPVPENDKWWGKGFTEWTNVTKSRPRFPGHYQPQLPADLGFYDLRLPEVRQQQAEMAQSYGIHGFCYYHYWFNGRRILERPFQEVLATGQPDFPFCLCWANENWTRRWDGWDQEVLLKQNYSIEDDVEHMRYLAEVFADSRYIRVDNKPLFIVYRTEQFPDIRRTADVWREEAHRLGIGEIYLARMESVGVPVDPRTIGFDAAIEFQPDWNNLPPRYLGDFGARVLNKAKVLASPYYKETVYSYKELMHKVLQKAPVEYKRFPGIMPSWDNSARRKIGSTVFHGATPQLYEEWLTTVVKSFNPYSLEENFVFINAWNEWAEGNHLEPCQLWGHQYLEATARALKAKR